MTKNKLRMIIAMSVVLVLYHLLAFLIPFPKTTVFWISYGFTLGSIAIMVVSLARAFRNGDDIQSKFYGFPIARIGVLYSGFQIVLGLAVMALGFMLKEIPWWPVLLVYAVLMGAALLGLIGADIVRDEIENQEEKLDQKVSAMRTIQSKVSQLTLLCEDEEIASEVKKFAEEVRYSDPVSCEALDEIEEDLAAIVHDLHQAILDEDSTAARKLCKTATSVLLERNRLCKLNK